MYIYVWKKSVCVKRKPPPGKIHFHAFRGEGYEVDTLSEELDRCPSVLGYAGASLLNIALLTDDTFLDMSLSKIVHQPALDRTVFDDATFAFVVGVAAKLKNGGGSRLPAKDRMCVPALTKPSDKIRLWKNLVPSHEADPKAPACEGSSLREHVNWAQVVVVADGPIFHYHYHK